MTREYDIHGVCISTVNNPRVLVFPSGSCGRCNHIKCFAIWQSCSSTHSPFHPPRNRAIYTHILGFLLVLASRVWFTSFNPIFIDFLYNNMATGTGVVLSLYLFVQDWRAPIIKGTDLPSTKVHREESERYPGVVVTGLGFGALLFLMLTVFGDVSVVSHWAVAPYPERGPYPYPWR